ncbi:MAG TPA: argininosuccinate synthase [Armatimonadota bacterium]|jgi:argininosuccinate synthase
MDRCVLAYSGGLDTSVAVRWIAEKYNVEIVAVAIDVGEEKNYESIRTKALQVGAVESIVIDARQEFFDGYITHALAANLMYEGRYPCFTALARPLLAQKQVEVALAQGAKYLAHGCTGKGNDQVRFEVTYMALAPQVEVIAPAREWGMTRDEEIDYAEQRGIPLPMTKANPYSTDTNLWGRSIEAGVIEDPSREAPDDAWQWTVDVMSAPDRPTYVKIDFEEGVPVALDGDRLPGAELVGRLNALAGANGVGRIDMLENRLVGIKSRELYEAPAATVLLEAHRDLEAMCLDRETAHFKPYLELRYAELVYYGLWFTPLREAIDAFVQETQKRVTGQVTMKLHKGRAMAVARTSERSLYDYALATYDKGDLFNPADSPGFIHLWGLPAQIAAQVDRKFE